MLFEGDARRQLERKMKAEARLPPGQSATLKWPVLHYGSVPHFDPERWDFRVSGLVEDLSGSRGPNSVPCRGFRSHATSIASRAGAALTTAGKVSPFARSFVVSGCDLARPSFWSMRNRVLPRMCPWRTWIVKTSYSLRITTDSR